MTGSDGTVVVSSRHLLSPHYHPAPHRIGVILVSDLPAARRLVLVFPELPAPVRLVSLLLPNLDAQASVSSRGTRLPPQGRSERKAQ